MNTSSVHVKTDYKVGADSTPTITVRKPNWVYKESEIPRHWFNGLSFATHLVNSYHIVFPEGERFFIRSVNAYRDHIKDPELLKEMKAFMQQEGQHGRMHEQFWDVMEKQGLEPRPFIKFYERTAYGKIEHYVRKFMGNSFPLSVTAGLEHYTAVLAQATFETGVLELDIPPVIRKLMYWHACEEIEHKAVAFDVYKQVDGGYFKRILGFFAATTLLLIFSGIGQFYFVRKDPTIRGMGYIRGFFRQINRHTFKLYASLPRHLLSYLRPGFHPNDMDNRKLADEWMAANLQGA